MLTSKQRAALRGAANGLDPVFQIGKGEIDEAMTAAIAACLDAAMERMDSPDAVWAYYYAHTARKIAPALEALGRAAAAQDLRERADMIYEGT